jgi:hypothetical protein
VNPKEEELDEDNSAAYETSDDDIQPGHEDSRLKTVTTTTSPLYLFVGKT